MLLPLLLDELCLAQSASLEVLVVVMMASSSPWPHLLLVVVEELPLLLLLASYLPRFSCLEVAVVLYLDVAQVAG